MAARVVVSFDGVIVDEVELARPVTVVGRHPDCDVVIEHPAVSGRHMLFRVVNRTVYAEDLASTNGMFVNGIRTSHQVLHHLDQLQVGRHKMHFFDDALLTTTVTDLESTVLTDYERTMLADNVSPPEAPLMRRDDDITRTMAIPQDSALRLSPSGSEGAAANGHDVAPLALRVLAGPHSGETITLDRANTMIGMAGSDTALVVKRAGTFYLARLSGHRPLRLNRRELGPGAHKLAENDVIDVGGSTFEVIAAP